MESITVCLAPGFLRYKAISEGSPDPAASKARDNAGFGIEPQGKGLANQPAYRPAAVDLTQLCLQTLAVWRYRDRIPPYLTQRWLHRLVIRPATALRRNPCNVAVGILHVAGFAVDAILRVDLEARTRGLLDPFINSGRTVTVRGTGEDVVLRRLLQIHVRDLEVNRLVLLMVGVGEEHRGQLVEGNLAVRLGIRDRLVLPGGIERLAVGLGMRLGAEQRCAEQCVAPHVEDAESGAEEGPELRQQRLGVADRVEILADGGVAPGVFIFDEFVIGATRAKRGRDVLGSQHAGAHRIVNALDAGNVDEARGAADQRAPWEAEPRHRLVAAFGDGACAIGQPLAAFERRTDGRMRLDALELVERRQIGIVVVQVNDETDRHEVVAIMVEEQAATRVVLQRPADGVLDQALLMLGRIDLPDFLQADAEFRRLALGVESVL